MLIKWDYTPGSTTNNLFSKAINEGWRSLFQLLKNFITLSSSNKWHIISHNCRV